jgi:hypothetical protein
MPLSGTVYIVSAAYDSEGLAAQDTPPSWITPAPQLGGKLGVEDRYIKVLTLDELLPMSFGPDNLNMGL